MKILFTFSIILIFALSSFAQEQQCTDLSDCNLKLAQAAQMVNKLLEVKKADDKAIVDLQVQIASLKTLVTELERQKVTPCSVAQEKFRVDVVFRAEKFEKADPANKAYLKQLEKILKRTMKQGSKAIQSQCGFDEKSALEKAWDIAKPLLPVAAILWEGNKYVFKDHRDFQSATDYLGKVGTN